MDFLKSMKKPKKEKPSKDAKAKKVEKSASKKVRTRGDKPPAPKSARSARKPKKKSIQKSERKSKKVSAPVANPPQANLHLAIMIFDQSTFTFKIDKTICPEPDKHTPLQKMAYECFASNIMSAGVEGLIKEYNDLIVPFIPTGHYDRAIFDANTEQKKNRYKDVVCNDKTRVVLRDGRPGDYIHANYVRGVKPLYILTQGPIKDSMTDFWRMVVQEGVAAICMLCDLVENGKTKCEAYYPDGMGDVLTFGDFTVTCTDTSVPDTHTQLKLLTVLDKKTGKTHKVSHYRVTTWPDKTVATSNLAVLRTHRVLRKFSGAVVIHCSAGVGRTGTFAAVEIGVQCLLNGKSFKLVDLVKAIRHCRLHSVQMDTQYLMLAEAILDCGVNFKYIEDTSLLEAIAIYKTKVAEYVERHPPPAEFVPKGKEGFAGTAANLIEKVLEEPPLVPFLAAPKQPSPVPGHTPPRLTTPPPPAPAPIPVEVVPTAAPVTPIKPATPPVPQPPQPPPPPAPAQPIVQTPAGPPPAPTSVHLPVSAGQRQTGGTYSMYL